MLRQPVELYGIAKHHVAACQHAAQRLAGCCTLVLPQVLAVVDVEAYRHSQLVGNVESLECSLCRLRRDGCSDARHVEVVAVLQYLSPGYHAGLEVVICRTRAVVDYLCRPHPCRRLEVVCADALSAVEHSAGVYAQLCEVHRPCMSYGGVWQAGDIGHVFALRSQ